MVTFTDRTCERDVIVALLDEPKLWSAYSGLIDCDCFTDTAASELYTAMSEVAANDLQPGRRELAKRYALGELGDSLEQIWQNYIPDHDALPQRVKRLSQLKQLRRAHRELQRVSSILDNPNTETHQAAEQVEKLHRTLGESLAPRKLNRVIGPMEWIDEGINEAERRMKAKEQGQEQYLNLGLPSLSRHIGLQPESLFLLAADTGRGKTNLALNMAAHIGVKKSTPSLYINAEMSEHELKFRLLGILAELPAAQLRTGLVKREEIKKAKKALKRYREKSQLHITPSWDSMALADIITTTRQYHTQHGIEVLFVDYLQRLGDYMGAGDRDWKELWRIAKALKSLAQELKIIAIVVVQADAGGQLVGSRGMKRDADAVCLLEQVDMDGSTGRRRLKLTITKNRHGADNIPVHLTFDPYSLRIGEEDNRHERTGN